VATRLVPPQVLELVARYTPADDQEVFSIMNLLDPMLRTLNSGVVLATLKGFTHLTKEMPQLHRQLYERIKPPILTLLAGGSPEVEFCVLKHTELLVHRCPGIFDDDYKQVLAAQGEHSVVVVRGDGTWRWYVVMVRGDGLW
jgi:vesicle coat complex subunit